MVEWGAVYQRWYIFEGQSEKFCGSLLVVNSANSANTTQYQHIDIHMHYSILCVTVLCCAVHVLYMYFTVKFYHILLYCRPTHL